MQKIFLNFLLPVRYLKVVANDGQFPGKSRGKALNRKNSQNNAMLHAVLCIMAVTRTQIVVTESDSNKKVFQPTRNSIL